MADSFLEQAENQRLLRQKRRGNSELIFSAKQSAGNNPVKLARILVAFDTVMHILGWQNKPLANLTHFLTHYQASIDAKYHNDFKEVQIAEEVERRREERKGISIMQS